jgi:regulatory protein
MDERKPKRLDTESLWLYALKALAGRAHSTGEMREKLRRRAAREADVPVLLDRLKECGYLNDSKFAEGYAVARLSSERFGRARVIQDLRQRRVAPALAQESVQRVYQDVDDEALIEEWLRHKYRLTPREGLFQDEKDLAAAYRRLLRAGFSSSPIICVLKRFAKNPELLDGMEPPSEVSE